MSAFQDSPPYYNPPQRNERDIQPNVQWNVHVKSQRKGTGISAESRGEILQMSLDL